MSDYLIEGSTQIYQGESTMALPWNLYARTDNLSEAREIAAKAFTKTNYLTIRIRKKS